MIQQEITTLLTNSEICHCKSKLFPDVSPSFQLVFHVRPRFVVPGCEI